MQNLPEGRNLLFDQIFLHENEDNLEVGSPGALLESANALRKSPLSCSFALLTHIDERCELLPDSCPQCLFIARWTEPDKHVRSKHCVEIRWILFLLRCKLIKIVTNNFQQQSKLPILVKHHLNVFDLCCNCSSLILKPPEDFSTLKLRIWTGLLSVHNWKFGF